MIAGRRHIVSHLRLAAALAALAVCRPAAPVDFSLSEFGTIGYARSDRDFRYQRFIDDDGTIKRDSVVGLQIDAQLSTSISTTIQVKVGADNGTDRRYEPSVSWGFVSFRPTNDWLIRAGKQRIPLYLYSETLDVGATYDFARLPNEMYSIVPSNDATGLSIDRTWKLGNGELTVEAYGGWSNNEIRFWKRAGVPAVEDAGPLFQRLDIHGGGLVLGFRSDDNRFRVGLHRAIIRTGDGSPLPADLGFVRIAPGIGYYQATNAIPGPGVSTLGSVRNTTFTIGADVALPGDVRAVAEFARSVVPDSKFAPQGNRGYLALLRPVGRWTPYVSYAFLRSPASQRDFYAAVDGARLPPFVPGAAAIDAAQQAGADRILVYHQSSWAFGGSYSLSATSKLKAEYLKTHVDDVSKLVDSPAGQTLRYRSIGVTSVSFSAVF